MEHDEQIRENDSDEKITILKKEIYCKTEYIEILNKKIKALTKNTYNKKYKELIDKDTELLSKMHTTLNEIKDSIPNFDEHILERYKSYFRLKTEIELIALEREKVLDIGTYMRERITKFEEEKQKN